MPESVQPEGLSTHERSRVWVSTGFSPLVSRPNSWTAIITDTRLENSRGDFWPPKTKMWSLGTEVRPMAWWFHSDVGSAGHTCGSSSSGL